MKALHPLAILALTCALLVSLSACGKEEAPPAPTEETPTAVEEPAEDPSLTALREELAQRQSPWAIAYLGTLTDDQTVDELLTAGPYLADYAFLGNPQVVTAPGKEVYCILPAAGASMTIHDFDALADSSSLAEPLYTGESQPVVLVCNESDTVSNTMVSITLADGTQPEGCVFSPSLSACDGTVAVPGTANAYDFSLITAAPTSPGEVTYLGDFSATVDLEGTDVLCHMTFREGGTMTYKVGYPNSEWMDIYDGTYYVVGENTQYPAGAVVFELNSTMGGAPLWGVYTVDHRNGTLTITQVSGDSLLYGFQGKPIPFSPM